MGSLLLVGFLLALAVVAFVIARSTTGGGSSMIRLAGVVLIGLAIVRLLTSFVFQVEAGTVAVPSTFGRVGDPITKPGINVKPQWVDVDILWVRDRQVTFNDEANGLGSITAQAAGGGNLKLDFTLQYNVNAATASTLWIKTRGDFEDTYIMPAARECGRDATPNINAEEAYTTKRAEVRENTFCCLSDDLGPRGINVIDVKMRDIDPGTDVRARIDQKIAAEQDLQKKQIDLAAAEVDAQIAAVEAKAVSDAEQIVQCGATSQIIDGVKVIVPKSEDECGATFSESYLQWLYIQTLKEMENVTLVDPSLSSGILLGDVGSAGSDNSPTSPGPGGDTP